MVRFWWKSSANTFFQRIRRFLVHGQRLTVYQQSHLVVMYKAVKDIGILMVLVRMERKIHI